MRFAEGMERRIHAVNCIGFIRGLEPDWADAILTGPSVNVLGNPKKRERRWAVRFARALKPGGTLILLGPPGWCEKQRYALGRAGFDVACVASVPDANHSGKEVLVAGLGGGGGLEPLPDPWDLGCSHIEWGSSVPIEECVALVEAYTRPGDLVLDPFAGMGTTAIACERTGRRWVGCEAEAGRARDAERRIGRDMEERQRAGIVIQPSRGQIQVAASLVALEGGHGVQG